MSSEAVEMEARARLLTLRQHWQTDNRDGECQLERVISLFNGIRKPEWYEKVGRDFPQLCARLAEVGCSIREFSVGLMVPVIESLDGTLQFKLEHMPDGDLRDEEFLRKLRLEMGSKHDTTLYWCACGNALVDQRIEFVFIVLENILTKYPHMDQPVTYTDVGEQGCLQTALVTDGLLRLGCPHVDIRVVNQPVIINGLGISCKMDIIKSKVTERYPEASVAVAVYSWEDIGRAAEQQSGVPVVALVDVSDDIDQLPLDRHRCISNGGKLKSGEAKPLQPPNFVKFVLADQYRVAVVFPLYGKPFYKKFSSCEYPDSIDKAIRGWMGATCRDEIFRQLVFEEGPANAFGSDLLNMGVSQISIGYYERVAQMDTAISLINAINSDEQPFMAMLNRAISTHSRDYLKVVIENGGLMY